ncbi:ABC transporter permease [Craterilacuibacter sp.]|uniref:ABC transporter permease n=1 Tax=Craterilacuibacter sp. TaxID=2870909 RepID=UPI003F33FB9E
MFQLEARPVPSGAMRLLSPVIAAVLMLASGFVLFTLLGQPAFKAFYVFFVQPLTTLYGVGEWLLKATPLLLCSLGLLVAYRANVWNIGAEGQLVMGAVAGGGVALAFPDAGASWLMPAMLVAGVLGGMAWAALPALLRTRFHTNEILVSLMLVYVAGLGLRFLVNGPWRDPEGFNFPQSRMFHEAAILPLLHSEMRVTVVALLAVLLAALVWLFMAKTWLGFRIQVAGQAPAAALYAGFGEKRNVWIAMLISGGFAGLAGVAEVAGPLGQLQPSVSPGYGFAAIIVAFVGRLHPVGAVLASLLMSLLYLGGETAQMELGLPAAITGLFQGLLLFYLLAADLFIHYRVRRSVRAPMPVLKEATR